MGNDSNWDSGWNTSGSGNPWDFEPKDPLGGGSSHETEERHAFGESDVPPWPSRNYDAPPPEREGCLGALIGMAALPLAMVLGAVIAIIN